MGSDFENLCVIARVLLLAGCGFVWVSVDFFWVMQRVFASWCTVVLGD
jgi:hypothetical protein